MITYDGHIATQATDVQRVLFRYPADYPSQPLVLKVVTTKGLTASDTRSLTKLLNTSSAEHAREGVVAGFSVADACQEFLLTKNNPEAAKIDQSVPTSSLNHLRASHPASQLDERHICVAGRWISVAQHA
jgi:hypothetical protein